MEEICWGIDWEPVSKASFDCTAFDEFRELGGLAFFDSMKIADAGCVYPDALKQDAGEIMVSSPTVDHWPVETAVALEFLARESGVELPHQA